MAAFFALCMIGLLVPVVTQDEYHLDVTTRIVEALMLAMGLRLILSTGRLSLAHVSFMGIGAYTSAALVMHLGVSFWIALPFAGLAAAAFAFVIGAITLRLTGAYFFLVTFAFMNVVELFFQNFFEDTFGGASGLSNVPRPDPISVFGHTIAFETKLQVYYLSLALFLIFGGILLRLEYSRFAMICNAIRQSEALSAIVGVNPLHWKVLAFVVASFVAGVVGSLFAHAEMVVHPTDFGINAMLRLVVFVVVGGIGSVWGAVAGTVGMSVIAESLRGLHYFETIVYGGVLVIVMLFFREGLIGAIQRLRPDLRLGRV